MEYIYEVWCKSCGQLAKFIFLFDARTYVDDFSATYPSYHHDLYIKSGDLIG